MTLDEAIKHCKNMAEEKENEAQDLEYSKLDWRHEANQCFKCAEEHRQLAEWLRELKQLKEQQSCEDAISRQAVFEQINCWIGSGEYRYTNATDYLCKRIKAISPVIPTQKSETVTEFADRCRECGTRYRKLLKEKNDVLDKIRAELHSTAEMHEDGVYYLRDEWIDEYFDKYKAESEE